MFRMSYRIITLVLFALIVAHPLEAVQEMAIDSATCLGCHGNNISEAAFANSVHGKNGCNSCHVQLTNLAKHVKGEIKVEKVHCERCHKKENAEHYSSVHIQKDIMCADCHRDVHTHQYWKNDKRIVVAKCIQCHDQEAIYRKSIHGISVAAGNQDSAACNDCHNLHEIKALGYSNDKATPETKVIMMYVEDLRHGFEWLEQALELPGGAPSTRAVALSGAALLARLVNINAFIALPRLTPRCLP